ncbi:MAG: hypothetical protein CVV27_13300 [Candidatus Melainabacteria bacterium HGW-Melainabacteria-1]|nr:MAG: hypothetical protein CVV27_13300 [Candidatus Melainabacteria bacterium HGW-Melainabacteria-1]
MFRARLAALCLVAIAVPGACLVPAPWQLTAAQAQAAASLLEQGRQAYADERFTEAIELLLHALNQGEQAEIYDYLGRAYYRLATYRLAIDAFSAAQRLYGESTPPMLLLSLAQAYTNAREHSLAQDTFNQVLNHPEADPDIRQQAETLLLQSLRDQSSAYQRAQTAFRAGRYDEARQAYEEVLQLIPDSPEIHFYLGISAYQALDFARARQALQRTIALAPDSDYAVSARQNLEVIERLEQNQPSRPFYGSLSLGTLADSNVNYGEVAANRFSSNQSESALQDLASTLNLNLNFSLNQITTLSYSYNLQRLYWGLNDNPERQLNSYDYNQQAHQVWMQHRIPLLDWLTLDLGTRSNMVVFAGEIFSLEAGLRPTLTFYQTPNMVTRAIFDLASERYAQLTERDNLNYSLGLDQFLYLWNSQTWLRFSYLFNHVLARDSLSSQLFEENGRFREIEYRYASSRSDNMLGIGFHFPVGPASLEIGSRFNFVLYNQPDVYRENRISINPLTGLPLPRQEISSNEVFREDTRLSFYILLEWQLAEHWRLLSRYNRSTNVSNISPDVIRTRTNRSYLKDELELSLRWEF